MLMVLCVHTRVVRFAIPTEGANMPLFRLYQSDETSPVGVVVAKSKAIADAFAQGKYGAGASSATFFASYTCDAG